MVHRVDDVRVRREQTVSLDFFHRLRHALLAERALDFLQRVERGITGRLDQVDVTETAFAQQSEDFEAAPVDFERWVRGEAVEAVAQLPYSVEDVV